MAVDVGEAIVAAAVAVGQFLVIDTEQVEHRGPEVVDRVDVFDGVIAELIGGAVDRARLHAAAGQPHAEPVRVVVATVGSLRERRPPKLTGPDHERRVKQPPSPEVGDQRRDRLIDLLRHRGVPLVQATVLIPGVGGSPAVAAQAGELDEPHAPLHQSSCQQALTAVVGRAGRLRVETIRRFRGRGLARDVAERRHLRLHAEGGFGIVNRRFDRGVAVGLGQKIAVEASHEVEPPPLGGTGAARSDVGDRLGGVGLEDRGLVLARQEGVAVHPHAPVRRLGLAALEHDVAGHVGVVTSQAVGGPRPGARESQEGKPGVHDVVALRVLVDGGGHRPHDRQLVHDGADVRKHRAHRDAALSPRPKLEGAGHDVAVVVELRPLHLHGHRLAVVGRQPRLGVKRIDLRHTPRHEAEDHVLGFGGMMGPMQGRIGGQERALDGGRGAASLAEQGCQRHAAKTRRACFE